MIRDDHDDRDPVWCPHNVNREVRDCGTCDQWDREAALADARERELVPAEAMAAAMDAMLRKIQQREDETKGQWLAERFDRGGHDD